MTVPDGRSLISITLPLIRIASNPLLIRPLLWVIVKPLHHRLTAFKARHTTGTMGEVALLTIAGRMLQVTPLMLATADIGIIMVTSMQQQITRLLFSEEMRR